MIVYQVSYVIDMFIDNRQPAAVDEGQKHSALYLIYVLHV